MKAAILISGHARSFKRCLPNLHWFVFRHFPGADFFVSTVKDDDSPDFDLFRAKYPASRVVIDAVAEQPQIPLPAGCPAEWLAGKPYTHEPYAISVPPQAVLAQLWQLNECWKLFQGTRTDDYDVVIRCRPDLWFHAAQPAPHVFSRDAYVPNWGQFGGCNDRFAILGWAAASHYFQTFEKIDRLWANGCPIHPESLVAASLEDGASSVQPLAKCEFSTLRKTGEMRAPEIIIADLLHAAAGS